MATAIEALRDARERTLAAGSARMRTETLELWYFGMSVEELDWTRLPGAQ